MTHLSLDQVVDAVEDTLTPVAWQHVTECAECRAKVAELASVLGDARAASVPEPSPLFWNHLSARVHEAVATDSDTPVARWRWPARWRTWPVLVPAAAAAVLALVLTAGERVTSRPPTALAPTSVVTSTLGVPAPHDVETGDEWGGALVADGSWGMVADLVGELDVDAAQDAGIATSLGAADAAVSALSIDEQHELWRLLNAELKRAGD